MANTVALFPPGSAGLAKLSPSGSNRVRIARTICIFFMTFVHVPPGIADNPYDRAAQPFDVVFFILTRMIGLSSVSLLSVVSGYFIVSTLLRLGYGELVVAKAKSLVVPLVVWNLTMLALLAAYGALSDHWNDMPEPTALGLVNALFGIAEWPAVVPLWFLRDLFVCCLASPVVLYGLARWSRSTIVALILFAFLGEGAHIMERPQLLLFFAFGMWLRIAGGDEERLDKVAGFFSIGLIAMAAVFLTIRIESISIAAMDPSLRLTLDTLLRITMGAATWRLTKVLNETTFGDVCANLEPYVFFMFCSHGILFVFAGIVFRRFFGNFGDDLFPITFFLLPVIGLLASVAALQIIRGVPSLLVLFNAGRRVPPLKGLVAASSSA
ncbi:acyltransferase family protein [Consotaella aegiceratis]|uniref:acyltransferase family protein n=1 Tax=Consotaella aegiceratis TaxID=3097961 RepID=UPI002F3E2376